MSQQKLIKGPHGLVIRFRGPMVITAKNSENYSYILRDITTNRKFKRHFSQLLPCKSAATRSLLAPQWSKNLISLKATAQPEHRDEEETGDTQEIET